MEPAGVCPRRQGEPVDASELQKALFAAISPPFFGAHKAAVEAAGYEAGAGFIKLPYGRELPTELLKALMRARFKEYETTHT